MRRIRPICWPGSCRDKSHAGQDRLGRTLGGDRQRRRAAAISTCGSRATAPGSIAARRSAACRWSSSSPPCCAARPTAVLAGHAGRARPHRGRGRALHRRRARRPRATAASSSLIFRTNLDESVAADGAHPPIRVAAIDTASGEPPSPISWCATGSRRGSCGRCSTSWSSSARSSGERVRGMEQRRFFPLGSWSPPGERRARSPRRLAAAPPAAAPLPGLRALEGGARRSRSQSGHAAGPAAAARRRCWCRWSTHPRACPCC